MASRRSRIKGIANIPQRRKPAIEAETAKEDDGESNLNSSIPSPKDAPNNCKQSPPNHTNTELAVHGITKLPLGPSLENNCPDKGDDVARPLPPCSPGKYVNRARIKAVPRLGQRRPSFSIGSASESEDESKKSFKVNRKRNDSVCSSASAMPAESPAPRQEVQGNCSPRKKQEFNIVIQRKCRRTEQSRKLAEARREFQLKFNNGKPDKQKLTMIDLIFYNPSGSPMSQKRKRKDTDAESVISQCEEDVDDAPPPPPAVTTDADAEQSDEENTVPAPQITVGPNGEIVIDEKSLYVENKDVAREREKLENSNLVDGDEFDTGYGVYKRPKRSKDWSKDETLRFYKALNTLGTDFTLMCGIFPGRSRRELKMKFSKEERTNRQLVDRALMNPIQFDLTDLEKDLARAEMEKARKEQLKTDLEEFKEQRRLVKEEKAKEDAKNNKENTDESDSVEVQRKRPRRVRIVAKEEMQARMACPNVREALKNKLQKGVNSLIEDCDSIDGDKTADETKENNNNDIIEIDKETEEVVQSVVAFVDDDYLISSQDIPVASSTQEDISEEVWEETEANSEDALVEGSVVLSTSMNENGKEIYKAFTVDKNGEKIPMELSAEILDTLLDNDNFVKTKETITEGVHEEENELASTQSTQELLAILDGTNSISDETEDTLVIDEQVETNVDITMSSLQASDLPLASGDCLILPFDDFDGTEIECL